MLVNQLIRARISQEILIADSDRLQWLVLRILVRIVLRNHRFLRGFRLFPIKTPNRLIIPAPDTTLRFVPYHFQDSSQNYSTQTQSVFSSEPTPFFLHFLRQFDLAVINHV